MSEAPVENLTAGQRAATAADAFPETTEATGAQNNADANSPAIASPDNSAVNNPPAAQAGTQVQTNGPAPGGNVNNAVTGPAVQGGATACRQMSPVLMAFMMMIRRPLPRVDVTRRYYNAGTGANTPFIQLQHVQFTFTDGDTIQNNVNIRSADSGYNSEEDDSDNESIQSMPSLLTVTSDNEEGLDDENDEEFDGDSSSDSD